MGLSEKVQYINKAQVLEILKDSDPAYTENINKLFAFTLPERDGEWIPVIDIDGNVLYQCSICGYHNIVQPYICERCGALMKKKEDKE